MRSRVERQSEEAEKAPRPGGRDWRSDLAEPACQRSAGTDRIGMRVPPKYENPVACCAVFLRLPDRS